MKLGDLNDRMKDLKSDEDPLVYFLLNSPYFFILYFFLLKFIVLLYFDRKSQFK